MLGLLAGLFFGMVTAAAQQPLYIVNGERYRTTSEIDPEVIEHIEELPADEFSIAQYGPEAANGVVLITLKYDTPARFTADTLAFADYLAQRIEWGETDPTARIILGYRIEQDGRLTIVRELESTDKRLRRRGTGRERLFNCWGKRHTSYGMCEDAFRCRSHCCRRFLRGSLLYSSGCRTACRQSAGFCQSRRSHHGDQDGSDAEPSDDHGGSGTAARARL